MTEWYLYIDESGDPNPKMIAGKEAVFSAGMLLTSFEITQSQINKALQELKNIKILKKLLILASWNCFGSRNISGRIRHSRH